MNPAVLEIQQRIRNKRNDTLQNKKMNKKERNYVSNLFTRILISIILILGCAIFVNMKDENLLYFKNKLFNETIPFAKINDLYTQYFGKIDPEMTQETTSVFQDMSKFVSIDAMDNSYKAKMNDNQISFLESGIVVFVGEKDGLGQTVIVQGIDGVDIWYSNLISNNITLYDYVEKDSILGEVNNNEIYLTFMSDGKYIGYENYIS